MILLLHSCFIPFLPVSFSHFISQLFNPKGILSIVPCDLIKRKTNKTDKSILTTKIIIVLSTEKLPTIYTTAFGSSKVTAPKADVPHYVPLSYVNCRKPSLP